MEICTQSRVVWPDKQGLREYRDPEMETEKLFEKGGVRKKTEKNSVRTQMSKGGGLWNYSYTWHGLFHS